MVGELVVADEGTVGLATGGAKLGLVNLLEELALVKLDRLVEILEDLSLRGVHDADLEGRAGLAAHHEMLEPTPRPFQSLKARVVHDRGELLRHRRIDLGDGRGDGLGDVLVELHRPLNGMLHQGVDQLVTARLFHRAGHLAGDLVEEAALRSLGMARNIRRSVVFLGR